MRMFDRLQNPRLAIALGCLVLFAGHSKATAQLVLTNLHSFSVFTNGANPMGGLTLGSDGNLYGTTSGGGTNGGNGTVFSLSNGVTTVLYEFTGGADGRSPNTGLVEGTNGLYYGTTKAGGIGGGTIFTISTNGILDTLYSFSPFIKTSDGNHPQAGLVLAGNGNYYGTTELGGSDNLGTIYQITPTGAYAQIYSFSGGTNGQSPIAALVQGADGGLYGTTYNGGANNDGTVFRMTTNGAWALLHAFAGSDGVNPTGLVQGTNGLLYGTTASGGLNSAGTAFQLMTNGTFTNLHSFNTSVDGGNPTGPLVFGPTGLMYGTLESGGANSFGTLFSMSTAGAVVNLYSFTGDNDGATPAGGLALGGDGNLYGTAEIGGAGFNTGGGGTVFQISPIGTMFTVVEIFPGVNDGATPSALVLGSNNIFYGTSQSGGTNGQGNVFRVGTNAPFTNLYSFTGFNDGSEPIGALVLGTNGFYYGVSEFGGTNGAGEVFKVSASGVVADIYSFTGEGDGGNPASALVLAPDGNFYGSTTTGTIFRITHSGNLTTLYTFPDGTYANGLILGTNGSLYGTSPNGGMGGNGSVFVIGTGGGTPTNLYSFTGGNDGSVPMTPMVQFNGNFYGTTSSGGDSGNGTIFEVTPAGALSTLHQFDSLTDGYSPSALLVDPNGNIFATTQYGGTNGDGNVFELTTNNDFINIYSFADELDGGLPQTSLTRGSDGSIFGTTSSGAVGGSGGVFRLYGPSLSFAPVITTQPPAAPLSLAGLLTTISITADCAEPFTYQWMHNGSPISSGTEYSGANTATLSINPTTSIDGGTYTVVVSNSYGSMTSSNAVVIVTASPTAQQYFDAGTNYVDIGNFLEAELAFTNALTQSPTNTSYNFFLAAAELFDLPQEPAGSNFLNHLGVSSMGRDLDNWQARLTNSVPIGVNAQEFTAQLRTNVLPAILTAQSNLSQITNTNFTADLTTNETHAGAVTVDWGDVQMLQALSDTAQLFIYTTYSWNLNVQLTTASNILKSTGSIQALLTNYPSLLTTSNTADLPLAKAAFTNACSNYFIASAFIRARPTNDVPALQHRPGQDKRGIPIPRNVDQPARLHERVACGTDRKLKLHRFGRGIFRWQFRSARLFARVSGRGFRLGHVSRCDVWRHFHRIKPNNRGTDICQTFRDGLKRNIAFCPI